MFPQDMQIIEKPDCPTPECKNKGLIYMGGSFYCGECVVKLNDYNNKMIIEKIRKASEASN